jgi:hypothetical protein
MTQENFIRHTLIATVEGKGVFITIKWTDGKLSICGVEGPKSNGDAWGSCGQIDMHDWKDYKAVGSIDLETIKRMWSRWHLNDMRAGDAVQEAWLRENGRGKDYTATCEKLKAAGLLIHEGYEYGHAWKREEVPAEVVAYLFALPEDGAKIPGCWRN